MHARSRWPDVAPIKGVTAGRPPFGFDLPPERRVRPGTHLRDHTSRLRAGKPVEHDVNLCGDLYGSLFGYLYGDLLGGGGLLWSRPERGREEAVEGVRLLDF